MEFEIRKLSKGDDRSDFSSGDTDIDRFFVTFAGQNQFKHNIGTTYVAIENQSRKIIGFITVSNSSMSVENIQEKQFQKLPKYPLPILRIARLGVDTRYQSRGVGAKLLKNMLFLSLELSDMAGCIGVLVDAKDDAVGFYEQYGFETIHLIDGESPVRPRQRAMYLSVGTIRRVLG